MPLNPTAVRAQFPALSRQAGGRTAAFFDGPGGTQVPQSVIDAIGGYLTSGSSNSGATFVTSRETDQVTADARMACADLLNANANEIVFGQNMTSLTFALSRALAKTWQAGDEIIVTRLDHDANISPWTLAAEERNVTVRWLDFEPEDCTLKMDHLAKLLNGRTRLLALGYASNAVGTINDVELATRMAHDAGAQIFIDAVHYAPHGPIDVQATDCDYLACSVYKFFGPHTGVLYGKHELLEQLDAYKVRPAPKAPPGKWETGTQSFESLAGVRAAVDYLATLGSGGTRRERLQSAMQHIKQYECELSRHFLQQAQTVPGLQVYGRTDDMTRRTPTFAVSLEGYSAEQLAHELGRQGFFVYSGHYYAVAVMQRLGLLDSGGLVRIGFVHYNTTDEIDSLIQALQQLAEDATG